MDWSNILDTLGEINARVPCDRAALTECLRSAESALFTPGLDFLSALRADRPPTVIAASVWWTVAADSDVAKNDPTVGSLLRECRMRHVESLARGETDHHAVSIAVRTWDRLSATFGFEVLPATPVEALHRIEAALAHAATLRDHAVTLMQQGVVSGADSTRAAEVLYALNEPELPRLAGWFQNIRLGLEADTAMPQGAVHTYTIAQPPVVQEKVAAAAESKPASDPFGGF